MKAVRTSLTLTNSTRLHGAKAQKAVCKLHIRRRENQKLHYVKFRKVAISIIVSIENGIHTQLVGLFLFKISYA
jgi:hypothetical protein